MEGRGTHWQKEGSRRQEWETAMRARTKDKEERAEVSSWLPGLWNSSGSVLLHCWLCLAQHPVLGRVSSRCVGRWHTESSCPECRGSSLERSGAGWGGAGGSHQCTTRQVLQSFTSARWALESFCANGTGGEWRIKSWALLSSHPGSEQGTAALLSYRFSATECFSAK